MADHTNVAPPAIAGPPAAEPSPDRPPLQMRTDIQFVPGVGRQRAALFRRLGINTAGQLLFFFPRAYEYPNPWSEIGQLREGVAAALVGEITEVDLSSRSAGKSVLGALVENETGAVRLLFFNQPYRMKTLTRGSRVIVSGVPRVAGLRMEFVHPTVTALGPDEAVPEGRILPIYPLVEGLKQSHLRRATQAVTDELAGRIDEVLPDSLRLAAGRQLSTAQLSTAQLNDKVAPAEPLAPVAMALRQVHCPDSDQHLASARQRLIFQELLVLQLALAIRRRRLTTELTAPPLPTSAMIDARIRNRFPFTLTDDQVAAMNDVGRDMGRQFPMNRLIQGDVGSGKTVVAQYAMLLAVAHGYQAVLMVPTEVLARQHEQTLRRCLADSRVRVGLLCGSLTAAQRREVLNATATGQIDVLVGTQALLYGQVRFDKLGLCVIDEQHKFGVDQRRALRQEGIDPHYLVLTATPIPRTLTMTLFGDLDVSCLKDKPPGRGEVRTYLGINDWKERWWQFVRNQLDEGRQAFVVTPRVQSGSTATDPIASENNPASDSNPAADDGRPDTDPDPAADTDPAADGEPAEAVASAIETFESLRSGPLADYRVDLLHGRMTTDNKNAAMRRFAQGRTQVLVSTTVIEVGIDVPNATVMTVLGAERFGLAQLHQLRGRVGRGQHDGHVCLFTDSPLDDSGENERLTRFCETNDGFEIAEIDYQLRGPGDLLGRRQSGLPPLMIADLQRDEAILQVARRLAQEIVDDDPELSQPGWELLAKQVLRRYGDVLALGDVA